MKDLRATITLMTSSSYKDRFKAEYWQTKIRYEKLKHFCDRIEASHQFDMPILCADEIPKPDVAPEEPKHDCPYRLLREQQEQMGKYLHTLEIRAIIEDIDLEEMTYTGVGEVAEG